MDGYGSGYESGERPQRGTEQSIRLTGRDDVRRQMGARTAVAPEAHARHAAPSSGDARVAAPRHDGRRPRGRAPRRRGVPVLAALVVCLLGVVVSALVTYFVMKPRVAEAQKQAKEANNQVTQLTVENKQLQEQLSVAQQKAETAAASPTTTGSATSAPATTASTEGVDSPWITNGKFSTGDATLDAEVKQFCDGIVDTSMPLDTALLEVYKGVAWADYVERAEAQHPSGADWRIRFARQFYENDCSGNCYEFAPFLAYCLRYMGLSDAIAEGCLIEQQSGGWGDHGIVFVTNTDGRKCLCDTARGTNGWMLDATSYNLTIQDFENA